MASVQKRTEAPESSIASAHNWAEAIELSGQIISKGIFIFFID